MISYSSTPAAPLEGETDREVAERIIAEAVRLLAVREATTFRKELTILLEAALAAVREESRAEIERLKALEQSMFDIGIDAWKARDAQADAAAEASEAALVKARTALERIAAWKKYSGRLLNEFDSDLSEEALMAGEYERGANDMVDTLAPIAREGLSTFAPSSETD